MHEDGEPERERGARRVSVDPFELLGHEIRIGVVEALVDARREDDCDGMLSFAELRDRVGVRDSGQFNYHLEKLRGEFVRKTDGGLRYLLSADCDVVEYERTG